MKLEIGITVSAPAVSEEYVVGTVTNILTNVVIVEADVKHYVVTKKVLKEQGYMIEEEVDTPLQPLEIEIWKQSFARAVCSFWVGSKSNIDDKVFNCQASDMFSNDPSSFLI